MPGEEEKVVTKDLCKIIHEQIKVRDGQVDRHLDKIDESLTSLANISEQNQTIIKILMEERSTQMLTEANEGKHKVWREPWFKYIIITGCTLVLLLALGAVSDRVINQCAQLIKVMPQ